MRSGKTDERTEVFFPVSEQFRRFRVNTLRQANHPFLLVVNIFGVRLAQNRTDD